MHGCRTLLIQSAEELRSVAPAWDDLWTRSSVTSPMVRADLIAQWVEHFQPRRRMHTLVVEASGRFVAALPMLEQPHGWMMTAGSLAGNEWSPCGDLLLDPAANDSAIDALLAEACRSGLQILRLQGIHLDADRWRHFRRVCPAIGATVAAREYFRSGRLAVGHDWEAYKLRLSRSLRYSMGRASRRMQKAGDVRFELQTDTPQSDIERKLLDGFAVEDRSWKGRAGTSVLRAPGMITFFVRQAKRLAEWGQLATAFLELDGHPIAFLYACCGKGVLHALKTGYDPAFAEFSPGQMLFSRLLEQMHRDRHIRMIDFVGPLTHSVSHWRPEPYSVGGLLVSPRSLRGRVAAHLYGKCWPVLDRIRGRTKS